MSCNCFDMVRGVEFLSMLASHGIDSGNRSELERPVLCISCNACHHERELLVLRRGPDLLPWEKTHGPIALCVDCIRMAAAKLDEGKR